MRDEQIVTIDHRYHWTDRDKYILRRRWDNTPDHPELENYPHPIPIGDTKTVIPGQSLSVVALLKILADELT